MFIATLHTRTIVLLRGPKFGEVLLTFIAVKYSGDTFFLKGSVTFKHARLRVPQSVSQQGVCFSTVLSSSLQHDLMVVYMATYICGRDALSMKDLHWLPVTVCVFFKAFV